MVRINGGNSKNAREIITGTERAEPRVAEIALPPNLSYIAKWWKSKKKNALFFYFYSHLNYFHLENISISHFHLSNQINKLLIKKKVEKNVNVLAGCTMYKMVFTKTNPVDRHTIMETS